MDTYIGAHGLSVPPVPDDCSATILGRSAVATETSRLWILRFQGPFFALAKSLWSWLIVEVNHLFPYCPFLSQASSLSPTVGTVLLCNAIVKSRFS